MDEGGLFEDGSSAKAGLHTCHRPFSSPKALTDEGYSEFGCQSIMQSIHPCGLRAVFGSPAHASQRFQSEILQVYVDAFLFVRNYSPGRNPQSPPSPGP